MTIVDPHAFSKVQVREAFNKAASHYDQFAIVQQEVCTRLLERLDYIKIQPKKILDIGAGTGQATEVLAQLYPKADVFALDIAQQMLLNNRHKVKKNTTAIKKIQQLIVPTSKIHYICADADYLPFADASVDMIFSSLTIQWCTDLNHLFHEFRRVLKPGGLLMFTTLGGQTLHELRASWSAVCDKVHVNQFVDMQDIGDVLQAVQMDVPVVDVETIVINYQSVRQILVDLKGVGAYNQNHGRASGLMGKNRLKAMYQAYEAYKIDQAYPVSYEVVYGHAWNPQTPMQDKQANQTFISLAQLTSSLRR